MINLEISRKGSGVADGRKSIDKPKPEMVTYPTGMDPSRAAVADLCDFFFGNGDDHTSKDSEIKVLTPGLRDYGGVEEFSGQAVTLKCYESNPLVRKTLNEDGHGKILVIDGGGSMKCALIGDMLSELAVQRGWSGIIVNGCVRDVAMIGGMDIGIKALASNPLKPGKRDLGRRDVPVVVCGVTIHPGDWIYADPDGVLVSPTELKVPQGGPVEKVGLTIPV
jgi:regulator of ribonuclease activity A